MRFWRFPSHWEGFRVHCASRPRMPQGERHAAGLWIGHRMLR